VTIIANRYRTHKEGKCPNYAPGYSHAACFESGDGLGLDFTMRTWWRDFIAVVYDYSWRGGSCWWCYVDWCRRNVYGCGRCIYRCRRCIYRGRWGIENWWRRGVVDRTRHRVVYWRRWRRLIIAWRHRARRRYWIWVHLSWIRLLNWSRVHLDLIIKCIYSSGGRNTVQIIKLPSAFTNLQKNHNFITKNNNSYKINGWSHNEAAIHYPCF